MRPSKPAVVAMTPPALRVVRQDGPYVFDERGRRYIDFVTGWCVGNLGWNAPSIAGPLARFRGPDYVYPGYAYKPWDELAAALGALAPGRLSAAVRATGGTEAVDLALQAALIHTGRSAIGSIEGAYHGNSLAAMSVSASSLGEDVPNLLAKCARFPAPLDDRALAKIEARLKKRDLAAFIMEPIIVNLGVLIPPRGFMSELARLCREHGTLLIMDEVATGFGRTGRLFACEHFGVEPDLLVLGKAVTNGLAPLGAVLARADVAASLREAGAYHSTYGWHPRSVEAALLTCRVWKKDGRRILANVDAVSALVRERIARMPFEKPVDARVAGLAVAVDFGDEAAAAEVGERCRKAGLLVSAEESTVFLFPPLTVAPAVARKAMDIFEGSV